MISQECYELGSKSSVIREIFSFGLKRKAEVGEDKVYDFSLGNPSIPAPPSVKRAILELLEELGPVPEELREKIMSQENQDVLSRWLKTAARAESLQGFAEKMDGSK